MGLFRSAENPSLPFPALSVEGPEATGGGGGRRGAFQWPLIQAVSKRLESRSKDDNLLLLVGEALANPPMAYVGHSWCRLKLHQDASTRRQ